MTPADDADGSHARIFVSIASYRDPETAWTVRSALQRARFPRRLVFGICWQYDASVDAERLFSNMPKPLFEGQIRSVSLRHDQACGPQWARYLIQSRLYRDEPFYLQIDSHMRFCHDFDVILIEEFNDARAQSPRPILTTYPPGYTRLGAEGQPEVDTGIAGGMIATRLYPRSFGDDGMLRIVGRAFDVAPSRPVPTPFWAAGFSFSRGDWVRDCPYDPNLRHVFFGEESVMAARIFTSGYDCFAPSRVVCCTKWSRDYRPTFRENPGSQSLTHLSVRRMRFVLEASDGDVDDIGDVGRYGLGRVRTMREYQQVAGVDFRKRSVLGDEPSCEKLSPMPALPPSITNRVLNLVINGV
ncbi:Glycosyltransferase (GlcNAc) [Plasmodiophora brassicae]|uniref:Uncharacterized protein n=1 Tax=Plasmodiophora brassicae TaxID=37360 RepID=A0A0G4IID7_PLABS|nr:hypothetical protein PBRA_003655 [Plasmodiophora brassicae]SPQ94174.1 unnamed protein product [Plasmodiophora brassicae]